MKNNVFIYLLFAALYVLTSTESYCQEIPQSVYYYFDTCNSLDPLEGIYDLTCYNTFIKKNSEEKGLTSIGKCVIYDSNSYLLVKCFYEDERSECGHFPASKKKWYFKRVGKTDIYNYQYPYMKKFVDYYITDKIIIENYQCFNMSVMIPIEIIKKALMEEFIYCRDYNNKFQNNFRVAAEIKEYFDDLALMGYKGCRYDLFFIKEYPNGKSTNHSGFISKESNWSGTGFSIGGRYIVTNNHVIEDAKTIIIKGINGRYEKEYLAQVVATDKYNDIAILKVTDNDFNGFGTIPYSIPTKMVDVGVDVFVLGYPLSQALGDEIKLTNGIVSSRTGYQGNPALYQMTAPVQPGNSGGPMFDSKGNIVGIVNAGVPGAENVGYAIKVSYLKNLVDSAGLNITLPSNNTISNLSLSEKVKRVKKFVYFIECSK